MRIIDRKDIGRVLLTNGPLGLGYLALCFVYLYWAWGHELGDFGGDSAFYLLTARYLSPWNTHDAVATYFASQSLYPPFYPLVLAILGGSESLLIAHLVTASALLLVFALFYWWSHHGGLTKSTAVLLVLLFSILPSTLMHALLILSENLYLIMTLACIAAVMAYEKSGRRHWLLIASLALAAAMLTRSAGIALMGAFFLYLILHRPKRAWLLGVIALTPVVLWQFFRPRADRNYLDAFLETYRQRLDQGLVNAIFENAQGLWHGWVLDFTVSQIGVMVLTAAGMLCFAGAVYRAYRCKLDGFYVLAYLALLMIWPYPAESSRFIFVVVPFLLAQGCFVFELFPRRKLGRFLKAPSPVFLIALIVVVLPHLILTAKRFYQGSSEEFSEFRHSAGWYALELSEALATVTTEKLLSDHMRKISEIVPSQDCIYSIKPSLLGYYAKRISTLPPRPHLDNREFASYLAANECRFVYMVGFASPSFPILYYPLDRMRNSLTVVSVAYLPGQEKQPISLLAERQ